MPPQAVFLDRDGTLLEHVRHLHRPAEVNLLPGVAAALATAQARAARLCLSTNQSGVAQDSLRSPP
jgi:D-glycero-D-manno-heptose 1,7-bisphosphate phosphatase